jgi:hypothetical protein
MRMLSLICAALFAVGLVGCSKKEGPVVVTAEMEAQQKQAEKEVHEAESAMQKRQKPGRTLSVDEEESAMQRRQAGR